VEENYNTIEILKAIEEILKKKVTSEKKKNSYLLPSDTLKIIAEAENHIKKN